MRTQATILIDKVNRRPLDLSDFLKRIFWKRQNLVDVAKAILEKLPFQDKDWKGIIGADGVTRSGFYSALGRLKACGLIYKADGEYRPSKDFSKATIELSEYWSAFLERRGQQNSKQ